jgi:hypothetical protein
MMIASAATGTDDTAIQTVTGRCAPSHPLPGLARSTTSCWPRTRFSASSRAGCANHDRITSNGVIRNATIGRFITVGPRARHPGYGFREAQQSTGDTCIMIASGYSPASRSPWQNGIVASSLLQPHVTNITAGRSDRRRRRPQNAWPVPFAIRQKRLAR